VAVCLSALHTFSSHDPFSPAGEKGPTAPNSLIEFSSSAMERDLSSPILPTFFSVGKLALLPLCEAFIIGAFIVRFIYHYNTLGDSSPCCP
jgi:hypothetical protein